MEKAWGEQNEDPPGERKKERKVKKKARQYFLSTHKNLYRLREQYP